jgi:hypothetical protein
MPAVTIRIIHAAKEMRAQRVAPRPRSVTLEFLAGISGGDYGSTTAVVSLRFPEPK